MAKKKSSFYHTRLNKVGLNEVRASEVLNVSVEQIIEWDEKGAPEIMERFLILWDKKHVGVTGWDGWIFSRGLLKYKGQQWGPETILYARKALERADQAEYELKKLNSVKGMIKIAKSIIKNR